MRVTGEVNEKYRSLKADIFEVKYENEWKETWAKEMELEVMNTLQLSPF